MLYLYPKGYKMNLSEFVKHKRKLVKLTQPELAEKAGVGFTDNQFNSFFCTKAPYLHQKYQLLFLCFHNN